MKDFCKRSLSLFLAIIMLTSMLSSSFLAIFANQTGVQRSASFINFYQDSDATLLEMKNLSVQDYYAMFLFMTNWFEPGKTTFADMYNPSTNSGSFFYNFVTGLGKDVSKESEGGTLKKLVSAFATDTFEAFADGTCVLYDSEGKILTGQNLLFAMIGAVEKTNTVFGYDLNTTKVLDGDGKVVDVNGFNIDEFNEMLEDMDRSPTEFLTDVFSNKGQTKNIKFVSNENTKVYFGNEKHLAFDFGEDAIRAAFQTVLAYNPDLFLQNYGVESCSVFFLDAVGNLWGCKDSTVVVQNEDTKPTISLDTSDMNSIYLVLPACLNPSTFTPNVTSKTSQSELRMPLMNRFVLSSMISDAKDFEDIEGKYVPIYNLLNYTNRQEVLSVIGLKTASPYTLKTGYIDDNIWSTYSRRQDLASFLYDYKEIAINKTKSSSGIAAIDSYAYIAFTMNINNLYGSIVDMKTGWWLWESALFSIFNLVDEDNDVIDANQDYALEAQKELLMYFFNPTLLPMDKVSMNFYRYDATAAEDAEALDAFIEEYIMNEKDTNEVGSVIDAGVVDGAVDVTIDDISTQALANSNIAELGLAGMGLYLKDIAVYSHDSTGASHIYVTPETVIPSRLITEISGAGGISNEDYQAIKSGNVPSKEKYKLTKYLFLGEGSSSVLDSNSNNVDFFITSEDTPNGKGGNITKYYFGSALDDEIDASLKRMDQLHGIDDLIETIRCTLLIVANSALSFLDYEVGPYHDTYFGLTYTFSLLDVFNGALGITIQMEEFGKDYDKLINTSTGFNAFKNSLPISKVEVFELDNTSVYNLDGYNGAPKNGDTDEVVDTIIYHSPTRGTKYQSADILKEKTTMLNPDFLSRISEVHWSWSLSDFGIQADSFCNYVGSGYNPQNLVSKSEKNGSTSNGNTYLGSSGDYNVSSGTASEGSHEFDTGTYADSSYNSDGTLKSGAETVKETKTGITNIEDLGGAGDYAINKYLNFVYDDTYNYVYLYIAPMTSVIANVGTNTEDIALGSLLSVEDTEIRTAITQRSSYLTSSESIGIYVPAEDIMDYILALYGYSILLPANGFDVVKTPSAVTLSVMGKTDLEKTESTMKMRQLSQDYMMGIYLGYIVDMAGLGTTSVDANNSKLYFKQFSSHFLPKYATSAKGGSLTLSEMTGSSISGVEKTEDLSFEEKQKNLIDRIYGLTNDTNNEYRNSWIKNIIEGFFLTIHRTITGTWGSSINTITTGSNSTYSSVTGYIYTPTLEELSFTATLMNNYIKIYIICLMCVFFITILMVLLHMRTWQQGLITVMIMCVALLFPYILISNSISISNKISNAVYSDRFDFWAMTEHQRSLTQLVGTEYMTDKDLWLVEGSATTDTTLTGQPGVKIKWMAPKKVDMFQNLYSDPDLSESFVTNIEIFKWLFNSFIYDSEFVDTDIYGSFVYRSYNSIALEAESYYAWGEDLLRVDSLIGNNVKTTLTYPTMSGSYSGTYELPIGYAKLLKSLQVYDVSKAGPFTAGIGYFDSSLYNSSSSVLKYPERVTLEQKIISQYASGSVATNDPELVPIWGLLSTEICDLLSDPTSTAKDKVPGVYSNLPSSSSATEEFVNAANKGDYNSISKAIFLKNTESPFYYFYSVLKSRYGNMDSTNTETWFKRSLLEGDMFIISTDEQKLLTTTNKNLMGKFRDYLDLEGLFTFVIPYMKMSNDYVIEWQNNNYSEIEEYNFEYNVTEDGEVDIESINNQNQTYQDAVIAKNNLNRVWNMYCPWVDTLYDLDVLNARVSFGGKTVYIADSLNPSSYIEQGRPMIFSEADMEMKGYSYKDLTDVERRIQAVLENTYKDMLYLINYYDMDDEVLLVAAAMYATFNFNQEFSQNNLLSESVELYPQGLELKNFNYDAFMRLALLNATGENVFDTSDLYERVLSKTNIFTGLLLILCDLVACVIIPAFKFIMLIGLLFLGILVCVACVVNTPDKVMKAVSESVLLPTALFMLLNIGFSWVMSFVVGEGLTTYVGSKGVNFATNDPTMTMLVMAALGIVYTIFAFKILKMLFKAYKKFGMTSVFATMGILSSAVTAGASKIMRKGSALLGAGAGAVVGAATAEKGNRLAGAFEGGTLGSRRVINQRIRDKRYREMMKHSGGSGGGTGVTSEIDAKAGGRSVDLKKKPEVKKPEVKKPDTKKPEVKKPDTKKSKKSETHTLDKPYKKTDNKDMNLYGRYLANKEYRKKKAADALEAKKYKKEMKDISLRKKRAEDALKKKEREKAAAKRREDFKNTPKRIKQKWVDYKKEGRKQAREAGKTYDSMNKERKSERKKQISDEKAAIRKIERKAGIKAPPKKKSTNSKKESAQKKAKDSLKDVKKK